MRKRQAGLGWAGQGKQDTALNKQEGRVSKQDATEVSTRGFRVGFGRTGRSYNTNHHDTTSVPAIAQLVKSFFFFFFLQKSPIAKVTKMKNMSS